MIMIIEKFMSGLRKVKLKKVIKRLTFFLGLLLIVIMTITNLAFNENFDFLKWLSNALILFGIMVFGILMGESIGYDKQVEDENGLFQISLRRYNEKKNALEHLFIYFPQFYLWFCDRELYNKKIGYLTNVGGISKSRAVKVVKYCNYEDYLRLRNETIMVEIKGEKKPIRKFNEIELPYFEKVYTNGITLDTFSSAYFLSAFGKGKNKSIVEKGKEIDKEIKFNKKSNRTVRFIFGLAISLMFSLLTVGEVMSGEQSQAWVNLVSRITALLTSFLSGYASEIIDVKLKAEKIDNKTDILVQFENAHNNNLYVAYEDDELDIKEYEKEQKEKEQAIENVVVPETLQIEDKTIYK